MKKTIEEDRIVVYPTGKITAENATAFSDELHEAFKDPTLTAVVDARDLVYISSAGLRALLTIAQNRQDKLLIINTCPDVYDVFEITGFSEIMDVRKKMRVISTEGCALIGKGAFGTVYRIDDETIVKVFRSSEDLPLIQMEQDRARRAFVLGIPTAIPFDIVQVGDSYGAVFESLRAENLKEVYLQNPDQKDELLRKYVQLMRKIHAAKANPEDLPSARNIFLRYIEDLKAILPEDLSARLRQLLSDMPDNLHITHGDMQMANVMMNGDELIVIDMETLSTGNPVFDLQALYVCYVAFNEDDPKNSEVFMGMTDAQCQEVWNGILTQYFDGCTPEEIRRREDRIRVLGSLRFLDRIVTNNMTAPELKEVRVRHTLEHLRELLQRTDSLEI